VKRKPVILRRRAERDVDEAIAWYREEQAPEAATSFVDELEATLQRVSRQPAAGSPRNAQELDIPGLRFWRVRKFPHLVFYVDREADIDVWRVLHAERDLPAWLREPSK